MTGGEPLLCLPSIIRISEYCSEVGIKTGINTNGHLITSPTTSKLKSVGLEVIKISIDALDDQILKKIRGKRANFEEILQGTMNALKNNFTVIWRFTLCQLNKSQMIPIYELAHSLGVHKMQIKPIIASGRAINTNISLSTIDIEINLSKLNKIYKREGTEVKALCWPDELSGGLPVERCGSLNKIYFYTDLKAIICNYVSNAIAIGSLHDNSFEDIFLNRSSQILKSNNNRKYVERCPQLTFIK